VAINKARGNVRNWNFIDQVILPKGDWKWKTYRNDFSFISAAPRKGGNGSGNGYGGNAKRKENPSVTMTKVKNTFVLRLTIKLYNYECGSTDRRKHKNTFEANGNGKYMRWGGEATGAL